MGVKEEKGREWEKPFVCVVCVCVFNVKGREHQIKRGERERE